MVQFNYNIKGAEKMTTFARRLKDLMQEEDITQIMLAEWVGRHRETIIRWLNGSISPRLEDIYKLAEIFRVSPCYLVGETEL